MLKRRLIAMLLCIAMIGSMTVYAVGDDTTCTCGTENDEHTSECALYVAPVTEPEVTEPVIDSDCTCGTGIGTHDTDCPLYKAPTFFEKIKATASLADFRAVLLAEENRNNVLALTAEEIEDLMAHVNALYAAIEAPTSDDTDTRDEMLETLTYLPAMECPECGEFGGHAEDCVRNIEALANKSGTVGATTISSNTTWNLTGDITLTGTILVKKGYTLKIYNDNDTERRITRGGNFTGDMFYVEEGATLHINGDGNCYGDWSVGAIVVDGNANYTATGQIIDCSGKLSLRDTVIRNNRGYNAIWLGGSGAGTATDQHHYTTIEITRTKIENCSATDAGGIMIAGSTPAGYTVEIWDSLIYNCTAVDGSAIYFSGKGQADVLMRESVVDDCDQYAGGEGSYGGALRTNGNGRFKFEMRDSILRNCDSWKFGGGIYWNASGVGSELKVIDCQFLNNSAAEMGGGMFLEGSNMTITATAGTPSQAYSTGFPGGDLVGTLIQGNNAPNGGGICYKCYSNSKDIQVPTTVANFNENVIFRNNTGRNGPALAYNLHDTENYPTGATFTFNINGAEFTNNTGTGYGGAIYINKHRTDYKLEVNFNYGSITDNTAKYGGAIAVVTADGVTTGGTVNMKGGTLSNNTATADGGALYVQKGNFNLSGGTVSDNEAQNGGAACLTDGSFNMSAGTLKNNNAKVSGGAVYVTGGDFTMSGGTIGGENAGNTATQNGGAAYIVGGQFKMTDGTISYNTAKLGGGAYVSGTSSVRGNVTVEHGSMLNNEAINGGAVYVNGGDFTMTSGTLSHNTAIEKTAGQAEAGNEGYGGGVYANNGNITIGVSGCTQDTPCEAHKTGKKTHHPLVTKNEAVFGGGLAVNNGKVTLYCCNIVENDSDNTGTGMNVFMSGENGEIIHYYYGANIGETNNHGMVSIGGKLTVIHGSDTLEIDIKYHSNDANFREDNVEVVWEGKAPENYYLNLPYCPSSWKPIPAAQGYAFAGWTEHAVDLSDAETIRAKDDYKAVGDPVEIEDATAGEKEIHFYAIWAPEINHIAYTYSLDGETVVALDEVDNKTIFGNKPETYKYQMTSYDLAIPSPSRAGYAFTGWKMYAENEKIANWDKDATKYEPTLISQVQDVTWKKDDNNNDVVGTLEILQNFGDIVMVAVFEPQFADLTIEKTGYNAYSSVDENQAFLFHVEGTPYDTNLSKVDMIVTVYGQDQVLIKDLPVGNYTVTELTDWSWRYGVAAENGITVSNAAATPNGTESVKFALIDPAKTVAVTFNNDRTTRSWLSGDSWCKNWWNGTGITDKNSSGGNTGAGEGA